MRSGETIPHDEAAGLSKPLRHKGLGDRFNIPMAHDFLDDFDIRLVFTKPCAKSVPQVVERLLSFPVLTLSAERLQGLRWKNSLWTGAYTLRASRKWWKKQEKKWTLSYGTRARPLRWIPAALEVIGNFLQLLQSLDIRFQSFASCARPCRGNRIRRLHKYS